MKIWLKNEIESKKKNFNKKTKKKKGPKWKKKNLWEIVIEKLNWIK
jgi:hypothetical protein